MASANLNRPQPYDPLDYDNLAQNVVRALMEQPRMALPPPEPFVGVGVYAVCYGGDLEYYAGVRASGAPIYVGSAVPAGKRKGGTEAPSNAKTLYNRLAQHARSIDQAENLSLGEFECRYLVVVPVWISLAERFLIEHFRPLWNTVVDGFGNHDPGSGRYNMKRPRWDILHPGRPWAEKLAPAETAHDIIAQVAG